MPSRLLTHEGNKLYNPIKEQQQLAQFSRNQELQADSIALEMLKQAGYDPFASPHFLQSMEAYSIFSSSLGHNKYLLRLSSKSSNHSTTDSPCEKKARKISVGHREKQIVILF